MDNHLTVLGAKVFANGKEVDFEVLVDDQVVTLILDREQLETVKGIELTLEIESKINEDAPIELIDNKATIQLNDNPSEDSNVVTVIPPKPLDSPVKEEITEETGKPEQPVKEENTEEMVKSEQPEETVLGKLLPKTATGVFNMLLFGSILIVIGGALLLRRYNKVTE